MYAIVIASCENDDNGGDNEFSVDIFYKEMSTLTLDIAYEPGAEPYTQTITGHPSWEFAEHNIESVFTTRPIALDAIVPTALSQMKSIPAQNKSSFKAAEIRSMASVYRSSEGTATDGNIFILFLNGYFYQNDSINQSVLGVHLTGTSIVAIFKPAINKGTLTLAIRHFTEQSVVVHELGHALGLVDNGTPVTSLHEDSAHPAHCNNQSCVMYWQNEFSLGLVSQVQNFRDGKKFIIFGPECVNDMRSYMP